MAASFVSVVGEYFSDMTFEQRCEWRWKSEQARQLFLEKALLGGAASASLACFDVLEGRLSKGIAWRRY